MLLKIIFFILGGIVGSFLNVCIYRMPRGESIVSPPSQCVHCGGRIKWHENIPLFSYIFLKGRCSSCKGVISPRYFVVELLTALLFLVFYSKFGISLNLFIFLALGCGLIAASFIDLEHQIIPDSISLGGLVLGLALSFFRKEPRFLNSIGGAAAGGLSIYLVGVFGKILFKKEAMGFGDVKFLAMIGSLLGWQKTLLVFFLAPFFGSGIGIILKIKYKAETIPYGPYLSLATLVVVMWGEEIISRLFYF